ncbi:MAG: site-specific DNA-methyltransferase [Bacteroidetes bacterium]|nr:site-specific DNA-methyltransferase [Bacteroidota bacterium]MBT6685504.1 site-specific DNA-methyltransferase [Bacteroidota bacterium]MBT7144362.1 site-specific DNA-methyltransferase [Bacteroidota bacterium]MBT7491798.1 site-specific DNA-methyltransferase [Bacteroidota bacterium]
MTELKDKSVDLVITSPPYWQLKDYGTENQIGYNDNYEEYINNLNLVWKESYRVLNNGCRLCVNIGDQFARAVYYGRYKVIPIRTEIIKFCEAVGFDYMGAIIWQKKTTSNTTGGASLMGSYPTPRNGILSIDYEFILLFKKLGTPIKPERELKEQSKMTKDEWKTYFDGHWNFGGARQDGHIAMFPEELPKRLVKMFSFVGDTILDPFLGSGTTSLAARNLNRNSVGYEMNPEFIPFIERKLEINQGDIFNSDYKFLKQEKLNIDFKSQIKELPYIFKDFHKFEKKTDPKKLQYGSKIDQNGTTKREDYFLVKEIISPELMKLNNDLVVRLIGVKEKKEANGKAIEFLQLKTKGQKVFFKYDETKHDENNNLMVYLYLKNKTFLNAHLIKNGFVNVSTDFTYKNKDKFIKLEKDFVQSK